MDRYAVALLCACMTVVPAARAASSTDAAPDVCAAPLDLGRLTAGLPRTRAKLIAGRPL